LVGGFLGFFFLGWVGGGGVGEGVFLSSFRSRKRSRTPMTRSMHRTQTMPPIRPTRRKTHYEPMAVRFSHGPLEAPDLEDRGSPIFDPCMPRKGQSNVRSPMPRLAKAPMKRVQATRTYQTTHAGARRRPTHAPRGLRLLPHPRSENPTNMQQMLHRALACADCAVTDRWRRRQAAAHAGLSRRKRLRSTRSPDTTPGPRQVSQRLGQRRRRHR